MLAAVRTLLRICGIGAAGGVAALAAVVVALLWPEPERPPNAEPGAQRVTIVETRQIVPGAGLPDDLALGPANNNLDVVRHGDGFTYLAFRNAPHHFASPDTRVIVVRSRDERRWSLEASFSLGTDLREPRLLSIGDELFLYVSRLGADPLAFEPQGMSMSVRSAAGGWSDLEPFGPAGTIGWRARWIDGVPALLVYRGGETTYQFGPPRQRIDLWRGDGWNWRLWDPDHGAVYVGGGGEADFSRAADGRFYGVIRAEAGDAAGWGSRVCSAESEHPARWTCTPDARKYDSPYAFSHAGVVYVVARRNLRGDGRFDRGIGPASGPGRALRSIWNQLNYSSSRKRCALWRFEPVGPRLAFVLDLPSRGDTCFPAVVAGADADEWIVYDYSSPLDTGLDPRWIDGQRGETRIYRHRLRFAAAAGAR